MPDMAQGLRTPLCRDLGIEYPIFSAGMGTGAGPDLAAAVSNAGGFGVIGASAFLPDAIPGLIAQVRDRTPRPFGVNFIIDERDSSDEDKAITRQQVSAAITERVAAVILFWGDPAPYVEEAHRHGVRIIIQVGSLDEAKAAAAAGVDAVIAQGVEAGGHVEARHRSGHCCRRWSRRSRPGRCSPRAASGTARGSRGRSAWERRGSPWAHVSS